MVKFNEQKYAVHFHFHFGFGFMVTIRKGWSSVGGGCSAVGQEILYILFPDSHFFVN